MKTMTVATSHFSKPPVHTLLIELPLSVLLRNHSMLLFRIKFFGYIIIFVIVIFAPISLSWKH